MSIKRKNKRRTTPWHSTPMQVYIIALVCVIFFFGVSVGLSHCNRSDCCDCGDWWSTFFLNVGYGTVGSIIVTLLVDIGNTKIQQKKDKMVFDRLNADLKELCIELPSEMYTTVYEVFGYNETNKYTFDQWTNKLLLADATDSEKQKKEILYIIQHVDLMKKTAVQLKSDLKYFYGNPNIDIDYERKLNRLINACLRITRMANRLDYKACTRIITEDLKNAVIDLYSELSLDYSRKYNEEDYIE